MNSEDSVQERYYDMLRLQRRANRALDAEVKEGSAALAVADDVLMREIDRLVRVGADPEIFRAIERAAWEAPDSADFARLAKETYVKVRIAAIAAEYGELPALRIGIRDSERRLTEQEERLSQLNASIGRLETTLEPVFEFNRKAWVKVLPENRKKIANSGFSDMWNGTELYQAANVVSNYRARNNTNCYDDMESLERGKKDVKVLAAQVDSLRDSHLRTLLAFRDMKEALGTLQECGVEDGAPVGVETFREELKTRLLDLNFLNSFARHTGAGVGGPVILKALGVHVRRKIHGDLSGFQKQVREITDLLEGPIGAIARAVKEPRAIEDIERDIKAQAIMAGYLCACAARSFRALDSFRPAHTEGPVSLMRDLQIHMAAGGNVDPAYVHDVLGLDRTLAGIFNVSVSRPQPDFKKVLADPASIERIDRHYAAFLRENAADKDIAAAGFAAGQFDIVSFERLLGRYFPAGTTFAELAAALNEEAESIEELESERVSMGIRPGGPSAPEFVQA